METYCETWQFRLTFGPAKVYAEFSNWISPHMRALGIGRPGFCTYLRVGSSRVIWHGEPFWKEILNIAIWTSLAKARCPFLRKQLEKCFGPKVTGARTMAERGGGPFGRSQFNMKSLFFIQFEQKSKKIS